MSCRPSLVDYDSCRAAATTLKPLRDSRICEYLKTTTLSSLCCLAAVDYQISFASLFRRTNFEILTSRVRVRSRRLGSLCCITLLLVAYLHALFNSSMSIGVTPRASGLTLKSSSRCVAPLSCVEVPLPRAGTLFQRGLVSRRVDYFDGSLTLPLGIICACV